MVWVYVFTGVAVPLLGVSAARILLYRRFSPRDRPERAAAGPLTLYEAAYLNGGRAHVAEVALTALFAARRLSVDDHGLGRATAEADQAPPDDPVQTAALGYLDGSGPLHARELRDRTAGSPATLRIEKALVDRGLAIDPRRWAWEENTELAQAVLVAAAVLAAVAACVADSATGQGSGLRPFLAFLGLGAVTGIVSLFTPPAHRPAYATAAGERRRAEVAADATWAPAPSPGTPIPADARRALVAVSRNGIGPFLGLGNLATALAPRKAGASPSSVSEPPSVGGCGAGCGGGCGGGV